MKTTTGLFLSLLFGLAAACMPTAVPTTPNIQVAITVVDADMLGNAVADALTATASSHVALTETALAINGITLTPTTTPTLTPSMTPTRFSSPTPTGTATPTALPTVTAYPSNTPVTDVETTDGQIRVLNAWQPRSGTPHVDVYFDDVVIALSMETSDITPYYTVDTTRAVRVILKLSADSNTAGSSNAEKSSTLVDQVIEVAQGNSITAVLLDSNDQAQLMSLNDDVSPLSSEQARVVFLNANSDLPRLNIRDNRSELVFGYNLGTGEHSGLLDLPTGDYAVELFDAESPDQLIVAAMPLTLNPYRNYLVVFLRSSEAEISGASYSTGMLVIPSSTRFRISDTPIRIVNATPSEGPITVDVDGIRLIDRLNVGDATPPLPISRAGGDFTVSNSAGNTLLTLRLAPWPEEEASQEKIFVIYDRPADEITTADPGPLTANVFVRQPPTSSVLANVRLINALTGATQTLDLEMRATSPTTIANPVGVPNNTENIQTWSRVIRNIGFGEVSGYVNRASNVFDLRLSLSVSGSVQATLERQILLPGGSYDVLALPGATVGTTQLLILGPDPQTAILGSRRGDPQIVDQIVAATLTAVAPQAVATLDVSRTPTPTISPVPTNTPRPSNTPEVQVPAIRVNPEPPNAASGSFILIGQNFKPNTRYSINLDNSGTLLEGLVSAEGEVALTVNLPPGTVPGSHVVRICADCREGGAQQEVLAAFVVADPRTTPTPTPQP